MRFEYGFDIDMDCRAPTKEIEKEFRNSGLTVGIWTATDPYTLHCCRFSPGYIKSDVF
ncbi:MAG: hypothetical protein J1E34_08540 [Oscillospiraceae bacterium]|nr:hypothetical protein [Oscillospiraceae bacterium]